MWIPASTADIEAAAKSGDLRETAGFDGKRQLPVAAKNASLAVDVAAMSTEGGALLYGVGEDENKRLTVCDPFTLAGAAERVDQIVQTSIMEPPYIEQHPFPTEGDPSVGYLLVVVPQSARAPHQVIVGGEYRFYGRGSTGNRLLTENEIALLYQRRQAWEQDADELLQRAIDRSRFNGPLSGGVLIASVAPVAAEPLVWERAVTAAGGRIELQSALKTAVVSQAVSGLHNFSNQTSWEQLGSDQLRLTTLRPTQLGDELPLYALDVELRVDGTGEFSCGGVVWARSESSEAQFQEANAADNFASFLMLMSTLYEFAGHRGSVDVGISLTGLAGAHSSTIPAHAFLHNPYKAAEYRRTRRVSTGELRDTKEVTAAMLGPLFAITTGDPQFDAFTWRR
jgi:hypothetical protein